MPDRKNDQKENAIQYAKTKECRYELFKLINAICQMRKTTDGCLYGYSKMVRTGNIEVFDYNKGFLEFSIKYIIQPEKHFVHVHIGTIDDGGAEAWREFSSKEECFKFIDDFATSVIKEMNEFPTMFELNTIMCKYEMWFETH